MYATRDDAGISIVEILVSVLILGVVLTAAFGVVTRNLRSLSDSRARQEASFVSSELLERVRDLPAANATMALAFDQTTVSCGGVTGTVDIIGDGSLCEPLVAATSGEIGDDPAWRGSSGPVDYRTFATTVSGTNAIRVTVVAEYDLTEGPQEVRRSTFVSRSARD